MNVNKKSLSIGKTNLGLGNVANLSPSDIALLLSTVRFRNFPDVPSADGEYVLSVKKSGRLVNYSWVEMSKTGIFT